MMIFSPFLITQCSLLTPSRFVQPSFCRDPFPIGTKEWKYPVDWLRIRTPELWLDVSRIIYEIYVPLSRDHLWSLDISPRLLTVTHTFLPPCDDMSNDDRSEFLSRVLSRVCQVSFRLVTCQNVTFRPTSPQSWNTNIHESWAITRVHRRKEWKLFKINHINIHFSSLLSGSISHCLWKSVETEEDILRLICLLIRAIIQLYSPSLRMSVFLLLPLH